MSENKDIRTYLLASRDNNTMSVFGDIWILMGDSMERKRSELAQASIFLVIFLGNLFLATRYYSRNDMIGMAIFSVVVVLSGIAMFGHLIEWRKA
jgi:small basic protein